MIVFDQVSKRYQGGYTALSNVSFELARGDMAVLIGHSGAGKSTLLKMLPAIERPSSGTVSINGQDISRLKPAAIPYLRRNLGLILQNSRLLYERTLFDNVMLPLMITGHANKDASTRISAALKRVGLAGREREYPAGLSGGEQQRLAIARAIVNRPSILIADEPTAHLDHGYAVDIARLFQSFHEAGVTIIVSTHDETLFNAIPSRRLILRSGKLVGNSPV